MIFLLDAGGFCSFFCNDKKQKMDGFINMLINPKVKLINQ